MLSRKQNIKKISYRSKIDFIILYADCRSYKLRKHLVNILYVFFIIALMRCLIVIVTLIVETFVIFQQRNLIEKCFVMFFMFIYLCV